MISVDISQRRTEVLNYLHEHPTLVRAELSERPDEWLRTELKKVESLREFCALPNYGTARDEHRARLDLSIDALRAEIHQREQAARDRTSQASLHYDRGSLQWTKFTAAIAVLALLVALWTVFLMYHPPGR